MPFPGYKTVAGFGVIRRHPWHLIGVFGTRREAQQAAKDAGDGYEVLFGEHREGSDDFIPNASDQRP